MALQSRKPWDTNSPIERKPTKGDAPTNSCSEPKNLRYLLLKAQRMAATKTEFIVLKKAA